MVDDHATRIRGLLARFGDGDTGAISELIAPTFFVHVPAPDEETATDVFVRFAADLKAAEAGDWESPVDTGSAQQAAIGNHRLIR